MVKEGEDVYQGRKESTHNKGTVDDREVMQKREQHREIRKNWKV